VATPFYIIAFETSFLSKFIAVVGFLHC